MINSIPNKTKDKESKKGKQNCSKAETEKDLTPDGMLVEEKRKEKQRVIRWEDSYPCYFTVLRCLAACSGSVSPPP